MCGIVGALSPEPVSVLLYEALAVLQHRGQDAAGIATSDGRRLNVRKDNGLVRDVFGACDMRDLIGNVGLGHVRYPTAGTSDPREAQPFCLTGPHVMALAHNGNIVNAEELRCELEQDGIELVTDSDSEVLLNIFARELPDHVGRPSDDDIFAAVREVNGICQGGYAVVVMLPNVGILAFRDPHGIRPVVFGRRRTLNGDEYMVASESVAIELAGFDLLRDISPGEAVIFRANSEPVSAICSDKVDSRACLFEFVYFARPDSVIDGISVHASRLAMGTKLADQLRDRWAQLAIDVVVPVPDTSRVAAIELAHQLGAAYREGFVKDRYIGRTFIMPSQRLRKKSVRRKLNVIGSEFRGKNVLLVDDSIVRGTTCSRIIQMVREAGAKNVYFASAAPPISHPNVYGIDMPVASELIAHGRSVEEVREAIGADGLFYQTLEDLIDAVSGCSAQCGGFESSVFSGDYVTGGVDERYLTELALSRSDRAKTAYLSGLGREGSGI